MMQHSTLSSPRSSDADNNDATPGNKKPCVGMVQARTQSLLKDGTYIAIFSKNSVLSFYANIEVCVLGGVVNIESFAVKPSDKYYPLFSPSNHCNPAMSMEAMDPHYSDKEFDAFLKPFRHVGLVHFHSKSDPSSPCAIPSGCGKGCVILDIGEEDIRTLNSLALSEWKNIVAVALLRPVDSNLTNLLAYCGVGIKSTQILKGLSIVKDEKAVQIPSYYKNIARGLTADLGVSVLICGDSETGKSTLGRYLINYMLNRFPAVGYLECDPGQCEFTCPEVLSLHVLTEPVFGPPYAHHRIPSMAYYFGDKTPKADPEYYIRSLQSLHSHFITAVRSADPHMPLIINTCGWLCDMGVQLFLDILRSLNPSHVIRLIPTKQSYTMDALKDLPPLTEAFLTTTPGLFTSANKSTFDSQQVDASCIQVYGEDSSRDSVSPSVMETTEKTEEEMWEEGVVSPSLLEDLENTGDLSSDMEVYGSSEDEFSISESSGAEENTPPAGDKMEGIRRKKKLKRKHLHLINAKLNVEKSQALEKRFVKMKIKMVKQWVKVLSYNVWCVVSPRTHNKNSLRQRKLGLIASFSPLLIVATEVAKERSLPDPCGNMLSYVPPLVVPWSDVAIHILHKQVPTDQILYAFNGKVVCLGHVQPEQIIEVSSSYPDMFKLLKSRTPLIEFIGLGLIRGIDPSKKLFYVTTSLTAHLLEKVNVFVLGNPDKINFTANPQSSLDLPNIPYQTKKFKPTELGNYVWNYSRNR